MTTNKTLAPTQRGILATIAVVAMALGCNPAIDGKKVEEVIKSQAATQSLELKTITCPARAPDKSGETFSCTATDDLGTQSTIAVTVTDPKSASITWKADLHFEKMNVIGDQLETALESKVGKKVDVTCPAKNVFIKVGVSFTCDAKTATESKKVKLTFKNADGACDFVVL